MESKEEEVLEHLKDGMAVREDGEVTDRVSIDEMLQKWAGEFGYWQFKHFVLTSLAWSAEALHTMVMIFADHQPDWQCTADATSCNPRESLCSMEPDSWEWLGGRGVSTVSEWGLICGEKYKVGAVQSMFFVGFLVGAGLFGHLSDSSLGRKGVLRLVCALNGVLGLATALAPNYWVYALMRALTGVSSGGVGLCAFVLVTEPVGPSKRGPVGMSAFYFFSAGIAILPALSYFFSSWRFLYVITSVPSLLFCVLVLPFVAESPRWYLVKGRANDAMNVMRSIATKNGNSLPEGVWLALDGRAGNCDTRAEASGTLADVLRSPLTRSRMIFMFFVWLACAVVYYGLSLNVVNLSANLYLSVFLNGITEMPAYAITAILLNKFGRKAMVASMMLLSGICAVVGSFISAHLGVNVGKLIPRNSGIGFLSGMQVACGLLGLFGMAGTYNLLYIYTAELFPTVVRNAALGFTSQASNIGAIIAPLIVVWGSVNPSLPFAVLGVFAIAGGFLAMGLPETMNQPFYETMEGMEYAEFSTDE